MYYCLYNRNGELNHHLFCNVKKLNYICNMKNIPNDIIELSQHFTSQGFELMIVGGAVRDSIIGIEPHDWDLATNAHPDKIVELLKEIEIN